MSLEKSVDGTPPRDYSVGKNMGIGGNSPNYIRTYFNYGTKGLGAIYGFFRGILKDVCIGWATGESARRRGGDFARVISGKGPKE